MIYITGDTHGIPEKFFLFEQLQKHIRQKMTKNDFIIVAGDFGFVMDNDYPRTIEFLNRFDFTILFIDGNHENFDLLNAFPVTTWKGGKVHKLSDNVIHLMRGEVYTIDGLTIFTFGGAESIDRHLRIENESWWASEVPTREEFENGLRNLEKVKNSVDVIITHTINSRILTHPCSNMPKYNFLPTQTTDMLEYFEQTVKYKKWFFGHFHYDLPLSENKIAIYNSFIKIAD